MNVTHSGMKRIHLTSDELRAVIHAGLDTFGLTAPESVQDMEIIFINEGTEKGGCQIAWGFLEKTEEHVLDIPTVPQRTGPGSSRDNFRPI